VGTTAVEDGVGLGVGVGNGVGVGVGNGVVSGDGLFVRPFAAASVLGLASTVGVGDDGDDGVGFLHFR
jgi:hypothetical protein